MHEALYISHLESTSDHGTKCFCPYSPHVAKKQGLGERTLQRTQPGVAITTNKYLQVSPCSLKFSCCHSPLEAVVSLRALLQRRHRSEDSGPKSQIEVLSWGLSEGTLGPGNMSEPQPTTSFRYAPEPEEGVLKLVSA